MKIILDWMWKISVFNGKTIFLEDFSSSPFPQKTMTEVILHKIFPFD